MILYVSAVKEILKKSKKTKGKRMCWLKGSVKSKKKLGVQTQNNQNIDTENSICVVCFEKFKDSRPGEQWIKCNHCKRWTHDSCTPGFSVYVCHHCESD